MIPFAISKFLMTKKLDGKNPMRYIAGVVTFLFSEQGKIMEFFREAPEKESAVRIDWNCSEGQRSQQRRRDHVSVSN